MKNNRVARIVRKFTELDLHDDILRSVAIHKLDADKNSAAIEIELVDDSTGKSKTLSFSGCGNIRYAMDFDVLADNAFASTHGVGSRTDIGRMRQFVRSQYPQWKTRYMPPSPKRKPVTKKLASLRNYALFRVTFFGGSLEILAKHFSVRHGSARH